MTAASARRSMGIRSVRATVPLPTGVACRAINRATLRASSTWRGWKSRKSRTSASNSAAYSSCLRCRRCRSAASLLR